MKETISVLIVDDHPIVRDGVLALLSSDPAFGPVQAVSGGEELLAFCKRNGPPGVLLSDVRMPGMDGFELGRKVRRLYPDTRVLFLAGLPLKNEEERARTEGAAGYLPKSIPGDRLKAILLDIAKGSADFVSELPTESADPSVLSGREMAVLRLLAKGLTREEIGEVEHVSPETVKTQVRSILLKLDVSNAVAAVATAYERGILRA